MKPVKVSWERSVYRNTCAPEAQKTCICSPLSRNWGRALDESSASFNLFIFGFCNGIGCLDALCDTGIMFFF